MNALGQTDGNDVVDAEGIHVVEPLISAAASKFLEAPTHLDAVLYQFPWVIRRRLPT